MNGAFLQDAHGCKGFGTTELDNHFVHNGGKSCAQSKWYDPGQNVDDGIRGGTRVQKVVTTYKTFATEQEAAFYSKMYSGTNIRLPIPLEFYQDATPQFLPKIQPGRSFLVEDVHALIWEPPLQHTMPPVAYQTPQQKALQALLANDRRALVRRLVVVLRVSSTLVITEVSGYVPATSPPPSCFVCSGTSRLARSTPPTQGRG
jgi:hypothetical protein